MVKPLSSIELKGPFASLFLVRPVEGRDWASVEILHAGHRLVLGGDGASDIRRNFLSGLDPAGPHRDMETGPSHVRILGERCFYFQGLASTSAIYGAYRPGGVLRLLVQGSQQDPDLEVVIDLAPAERATWARQVQVWDQSP